MVKGVETPSDVFHDPDPAVNGWAREKRRFQRAEPKVNNRL